VSTAKLEAWLPLVMLLVWSGLLRWRIHIHCQRTGRNPVFFGRDRNPGQRLRDGFAALGLILLFIIAVLAGNGQVELAVHPLQRLAGIALGIGGSLMMFAAQHDMGASWRIGIDPDARTPLVTTGWYRFCRNPIYLFLFMGSIGFALLVPNFFTWCTAAGLMVGLRVQALREETWLAATYGEEWRTYAARTGRFVPGIGRIRA
jgi:protein-S-isoprenylcysteine O-methyltransferase Ste14